MFEGYLNALESSDSDVRLEATEVLGALGDKRAIEPLIERLGDSDGRVRHTAAQALGALGDKRAVEPLIERLSDSGRDVRQAATATLEQLGATKEQVFKGYLTALEALDSQAREAATEALGALGDKRAVEPLIESLSD